MQHDNDLVQEAWINLKTGDKVLARRYAERALLTVDDQDTKVKAFFILSQTTDDPKEKRAHLEDVLAYEPSHAEARRALAILDGKLKPQDIVNADDLPSQSSDPQNASADRFTCPQCGARRVFAPDGKSLLCENCGYNDALSSGQAADEKDFFIAMATAKGHRKPVAMQVFHCNGCGAEFVLAPGVISTTCSYCDSPHVVRLDRSRDLLEPDGIIPYALTLKQIIEKLVFWVDLYHHRPERKVDQPRPVYLPIWTFDLGGSINVSGEKLEMEELSALTLKRSRSKMRLVHVSEPYPVLVNDRVVPASKKNTNILNLLLPTFDLAAVKPYDERYLSDWPAEIYDIIMSDAALEARAQVVQEYTARLEGQYSLQNMSLSSAGMTVESFKLVLLPVWMTEMVINSEVVHILFNGQNGRIVTY
jgi:predicted RNA-binding Zn-ribbon protein involved in translation (DUF1610 family)